MRALHAFLTTVSPLVILSACDRQKTESPPPQRYDGSRIVSMRLLMPDGSEDTVTNIPDSTDAVFTSASVLDSILIWYYEEKKKDPETAKTLRDARARVGPPQQRYDGSRIVSMRLLMPDGSEDTVTNVPDSTDAVFTSASVLDKILIPYYEEKKKDTETAKMLRDARASVGDTSAHSEDTVTTIPGSTDAAFTSASVLDWILIPFYVEKEGKDRATVKELRKQQASAQNPSAYVVHKLHSKSSVESIE